MFLCQIFVFILVLGHFMANMWIILGGLDDEGCSTWICANDMPPPYGNVYTLWATAFYWIFEVISTAGYGDFSYSSNYEYLFAIVIEFTGVTFNAILVGTVSGVFDGELDFGVLMSDKMDQLMLWVKKIENCNKYIETEATDKSLEPRLYGDISRFIEEAFLYDFNLIVEEFDMYQKLTPKMQTDVINTLEVFVVFIKKFDHFFSSCEIGYRNECVMQMYTREFPSNEELVGKGKKFREVFFITSGAVNLFAETEEGQK